MKQILPPPLPASIQRISVVGTTGSGKSYLAAKLAASLDIPYIELDALHWGPNWTHCSDEEMSSRVDAATRAKAWVVDGNYSLVRDLVWARTEAVIWLDYSLPLILWRLFKRTLKRYFKRELLWGINKERFWPQFFSRDSLFLWALSTYRRRKLTYLSLISSPVYASLKIYRFTSPPALEAWLLSWISTASSSTTG